MEEYLCDKFEREKAKSLFPNSRMNSRLTLTGVFGMMPAFGAVVRN
jgi:hypothetical protein